MQEEDRNQLNPDKPHALDLRYVPRPHRHPLVFAEFDSLAVGDSMELVNDHDPMPLNMQIDRMRPGQAAWEYVERGPEIFHIRIRRVAPSRASDPPLNMPPTDPLVGIKGA